MSQGCPRGGSRIPPHVHVKLILKTFISSNVDISLKKKLFPIPLPFPFQPRSLGTPTRGINLYVKPVWPVIDIRTV